jgi:WD40 repeat protein
MYIMWKDQKKNLQIHLAFTVKNWFLIQITLSGHDNYIHSLALKNGNTCASAAEDGTVKIWGNYDL